MNESDVDGRKLSATFERALDGVGADLGPLVAGAAERGRSIRRRRRTTAAGAAAVAAVLVVGGALTLRPGGGNAAVTVQAPTASASPMPSRAFPQLLQKSDTGPERLDPGTGAQQGSVALTGHAAVLTLARALPPGGHTSGFSGYSGVVGWTEAPTRNVAARATLLYDDGTGPVEVGVEVDGGIGALYRPGSYPPGPGQDPYVIGYDDEYDCTKTVAPNIRSCSATVLPDGGHLKLTESVLDRVTTRTVNLLRPDNTRVIVTATNSVPVADSRKPQPLREGLPLSLDQLQTAAMAAGFHEWITPEEAERAEEAVRPFHDDTPGKNMPSGTGSGANAGAATAGPTPGGKG
ncbi:hypothetical protein BX285_2334 [Streptomyces sp. 1114.5]|uniref:hypothetical protein n=1 Tax=Streptomyces sp. 1114.5 TaxID=1938830 RepID=UPI000EB3693A|nr:hypothetical protein [Streptomyces sp. 1114.5]RKT17927.1 hypothetical protein BX285_2334 [Streptomyces sp. 1114.5]